MQVIAFEIQFEQQFKVATEPRRKRKNFFCSPSVSLTREPPFNLYLSFWCSLLAILLAFRHPHTISILFIRFVSATIRFYSSSLSFSVARTRERSFARFLFPHLYYYAIASALSLPIFIYPLESVLFFCLRFVYLLHLDTFFRDFNYK